MLFFFRKKYIFFVFVGMIVLSKCTTTSKPPFASSSSKDIYVPLEPQKFYAKSKFLDNDKSIRVYLSIHLGRQISPDDFKKDITFIVNVYNDYTMGKPLYSPIVVLNADNVNQHGDWIDVWFDFPKIPNLQSSGVVITEIVDNLTKDRIRTDMVFRQDSKRLGDNFLFFSNKNNQKFNPVLHNYLAMGDTIVLKSLVASTQKLKVSVFGYEFEQAMPPMSYLSKNNSKTLTVDTTFDMQVNEPFVLKRKGLYYFSKDSTENFGIGVVAVDERFPRMTYPETLLKPLVYMSTNAESYEIKKSKDHKNTLDKYWLNLPIAQLGTASQTLKEYYKRVEESNQLYTTYKEGWKTDKGMVWIIMGSPFKIAKSKEKEIWTYQKNGHQVEFHFLKRINQFSENHYELQRNADFQSVWYPMIEHWRNGDLTYLK